MGKSGAKTTKILDLLANKLALGITREHISRAHRIGRFSSSKARPVIVNFESYKSKEQILSKRTELKDNRIAVSEDYCAATRHARKKLINYAKSRNVPVKLKYKKLVINGRYYSYNANDDVVYEITSNDNVSGSGESSTRYLRSGRAVSAARR